MAKVSFNKLGLKKVEEIKTITINDVDIEVKQYLPIEEKLELIADVLNFSVDEVNSFANPVKVDILSHLNIIFYYTNLSFTDKQKENIPKLYDLLETNGVIAEVIKTMPQAEYTNLIEDIDATVESYYKYKNSVLGILETVSQDYSSLDLDASKIQEKLGKAENVEFLKEVMDKLA